MSGIDESRLIEDIQRRIQYQVDHTWHNLIDSTLKDQFLNNFSEGEKIAGLVLLDMLLFHNQAQEKQLVRSLIRKLQSSIYKREHPNQEESSDTIVKYIQKEMKSAAFVPVSDKNPADSSNAWSALVREITGTSDCFFEVNVLPLLLLLKKKYIVFYDDMIGTGTQFDTFLSQGKFKLNEKKAISIKEIMEENSDITCYYLCLAGYKEGVSKIKKSYPWIHVIVSEVFDEEDSVLSKSNEYWAYYEKDERDKIIDILARIIREKNINDPFTRNLPIIFERNRPSNTVFPLYWNSKNGWKPIKERENKNP